MQAGRFLGTTETRSYNSSGQLGGINWNTPGVAAMTGGVQYSYSTTGNNGQITQTADTLSGEATVYQYDSLKRLVAADSTPTAGSADLPPQTAQSRI